jgi:hypothetical protein
MNEEARTATIYPRSKNKKDPNTTDSSDLSFKDLCAIRTRNRKNQK